MKGDIKNFINWFLTIWIDRFESKSIIIDTLYKDMEILYDLPESRIINFVDNIKIFIIMYHYWWIFRLNIQTYSFER